MIAPLSAAVNRRILHRTYQLDNRVACMTYRDAELGLVAVSIRSAAGIIKNPPGIAWDSGILAKLERAKVDWLEVQIRGGYTYRATLETMNTYGRWDERYQRQLVLSLGFWATDEPPAPVSPQTDDSDVPQQMSLF